MVGVIGVGELIKVALADELIVDDGLTLDVLDCVRLTVPLRVPEILGEAPREIEAVFDAVCDVVSLLVHVIVTVPVRVFDGVSDQVLSREPVLDFVCVTVPETDGVPVGETD